MKNTVYVMAARHPVQDPESFGMRLGEHFLDRNPRLRCVTVDFVEYQWRRIEIGEREHGQAFMRRGPDTRVASVSATRERTIACWPLP
jgi:urate oxidase